MRIRAAAIVFLASWAIVALSGCGADAEGDLDDTSHANMTGETADCEFDVVTVAVSGGEPVEVHIDGLPVVELAGADKVSGEVWEAVTRRGVRFSEIFARGGITVADETPVNCVARDGFDPLRTRLEGDTTRLPTFAFVRDHGYVYVGNPGDHDPLYPQMEGRGLIVDYDLDADADVPEYLGGTLASLGMFRWKMIEKVDDQQRGIIEIDPGVE